MSQTAMENLDAQQLSRSSTPPDEVSEFENNISISIVPPALDPAYLNSLSKEGSPSSSGSSDRTPEIQFDLRKELNNLLGRSLQLQDPKLLRPFCKLMNSCTKVDEILTMLKILSNGSKQLLDQFVSSKGMAILFNWRLQVGKEREHMLIYLKLLNLLPFKVSVFRDIPIPKFLNKQWSRSEIPDVRNATVTLLEKWKKIASESAEPARKSKPVEPVVPDHAQQPKRPRTAESIAPESKKPRVAVSSFDIFKKMSEPIKKVVPVEERKRSTDLSGSVNSKTSDDVSIQSFSTMKITKTASPSADVPSISAKTGKPKKTVRFVSGPELCTVKLFDQSDRVDVISSGNSASMSELPPMVVDMDAQIDWYPPKPVRIPFAPLSKVESKEAELQEKRERNVLSVIYVNPKDIPNSPAEPDYEPDLMAAPPAKRPLNTIIESLPTAVSSLPLPFLSTLLGSAQLPQQQQWGTANAWIPYQVPNSNPTINMGNFGLPSQPIKANNIQPKFRKK